MKIKGYHFQDRNLNDLEKLEKLTAEILKGDEHEHKSKTKILAVSGRQH